MEKSKSVKVSKLANAEKPKVVKTKIVDPSDPFPVTLKKTQIKEVINLFKGTKTQEKVPVGKIAEIVGVDKKQVFRVLHKENLKTYKESSLK